MSEKHFIEMTTGNFEISFYFTPKPEVESELIQKGSKSELERNVLTKSYLDMAGVPGKRAGKRVLPAGFERKDIEYSKQNADNMADRVKTHFAKLGTVDAVSINQWFESQAESKFVEERATLLRHESALNDLETWLEEKVKFHGEVHDEFGEYTEEVLNAVRSYAKWVRANM